MDYRYSLGDRGLVIIAFARSFDTIIEDRPRYIVIDSNSDFIDIQNVNTNACIENCYKPWLTMHSLLSPIILLVQLQKLKIKFDTIFFIKSRFIGGSMNNLMGCMASTIKLFSG